MMQTLCATLLITMFALKGTPIGQLIGRQQFHDVGKLMHGFTIFFAYLTYAHVLTHWYGNMPEETEYYLHRLHGPWFWIIVIAPIFSFVIPLFALLPKASKWTAAITIPVALSILGAQWFADMLIVMPEVTNSFGIPWIEVGTLLGFIGLFGTMFFRFAAKTPMVAIADPLLPQALSGGHH
jgi:hypothetical protein